MIFVDNALPDADRAREHALGTEFRDVTGPDGVVYPNTSMDVPAWLGTSLYTFLRTLAGPIRPHYLFFRLNTADTPIPHWVHSDGILCDYLAVLSLTRDEATPDGAGTAIMRHESGMLRHPEGDEEVALWHRDTNDPGKWAVLDFAPMRYNRAVIMHADRLHAACPAGGFGSGPEDGRLVLTTFFSRIK